MSARGVTVRPSESAVAARVVDDVTLVVTHEHRYDDAGHSETGAWVIVRPDARDYWYAPGIGRIDDVDRHDRVYGSRWPRVRVAHVIAGRYATREEALRAAEESVYVPTYGDPVVAAHDLPLAMGRA